MKHSLLIALILLLNFCSTAKGDFDYHPNSAIGTKYFAGNESYSTAANFYVYCFDNKIAFGRKIKEDAGFNIQHHYLYLYTYSLMGRSNRNLPKMLEDELLELEGKFDPETEAVAVHNFRFETSPNSWLDILNYYMLGTFFRMNFIKYSVDINIVPKSQLISMGLELPPSSPTASTPNPKEVVDDPAFSDIVVLKNGDILEGVKTVVTAKDLIVTDAKGNTTVYPKKEVLSVKKKKKK